MRNLLSNESDSKKLQRAWDLDQKALFLADKDIQKKLWSEAINICKKLLKKYGNNFPDNLQIIYKIFLIYLHQKKILLAKRYIDKAWNLDKNNPITLFNYGNFYRAINKPKLAIKYYESASKKSSTKIFGEELKKYLTFINKNKKG
ncbi:hypothetical protein A2533_00950 [Candidatus Falkowbacteria bacterium RIFOXYD2_FULL_35_9]|uniref:Uncharacterized protein n=1 Tax=Candidatus Falkowbacteria bacterium RIFOXYC2_FULL_36_12 TaxID=1798002 RepID=A0A1F5SYY3_9BACT|nr:MAG: hypothetical protein A2300_03340 [Candidatus Falkowbacteria bacterium RIFOXYB2_FULL_35_7]OGF31852.1 MAG: hypothetical protein A2478_05205 [Candidatus Falkowbacteria bacterium RIFOXYC2_FULL_36_12]OGF34626.1 MAG: hypothetical protein A2223_00570 [Candidatus Falkowbacteria bacterium RIFOXYA2_FULL_35_8]OGF45843.1 MAG: hypothetical protein A2533_00950 [Candidatus Falkowbacteria bacterium RIFOXYD2_FULL_35_9]